MRGSRGSARRPEQVAETIRQVVADTVMRELRDPRLGFVTITGVQVTNDLSLARVRFSVLGEEEDREKALVALESAAGFLRSRLGKVLHLRTVPELRFEIDRGIEHAARINRLLEELKREERD
ncbi:MAG TPA: 30S ribosome-binding factor RbfA [Gemmatimonadales bacterium]|nr:30S ribosome-binding factor RbfA [Gemmatimonadales bacterium]